MPHGASLRTYSSGCPTGQVCATRRHVCPRSSSEPPGRDWKCRTAAPSRHDRREDSFRALSPPAPFFPDIPDSPRRAVPRRDAPQDRRPPTRQVLPVSFPGLRPAPFSIRRNERVSFCAPLLGWTAFLKGLMQRFLIYYIPLFADCKFRNRLHPASGIGVPDEVVRSCKSSHNTAPRSGAAASCIHFSGV